MIRKQFEDQMPRWVQKLSKAQIHWDCAIQTLEGHSNSVNAVAFSPDGKQLASASDDRTIKLWDPATGGAALQMLNIDSVVVTLSFSRDGSYLITDRGVIDTASLFPTVIPPQPTVLRGIFVKEQWIAYKMENVLWLPFEFRATYVAVRDNTVALGHTSGHVSIIHFKI
jgi:Tol biopolymer transport system component